MHEVYNLGGLQRTTVAGPRTLRRSGSGTGYRFARSRSAQERAFLNAIESTEAYKIVGETLDLYDSADKLLARFESRYLR